ncbi:hypothetical protein IFR05_002352 [Cadophora sp. M221]|nr:hypothetical protein IFR05_002352 [Cadophora sp. M221]
MKISSILLTVPFLGFSLAAPAPVAEVLEAETFNSTSASFEKRIANTMCERYISPGFLDNLRAQCGGTSSVSGWKCYEVHENPHDTMMTFSFNTWAQPVASGGSKCVQDAIWLASPSWKKEYGVTCKHLNS